MQHYDITIVTIYNYLHFLYTGLTNTITVTNARKQPTDGLHGQQLEEFDYADPESSTLAIRRLATPTTGSNEPLTDVVETNNMTALTLAKPADEAPTTSITATSKRDSQIMSE